MKNILYIETGVTSGGSFESLYQTVLGLDKEKYKPSVIFLNKNKYLAKFDELKINYYLLDDCLWSVSKAGIKQKLLRVINNQIGKYLPCVYSAFLSILKKNEINQVLKIIKDNNINLVHLNTQPLRDYFGIIAAQKANIKCVSHIRSRDIAFFSASVAKYANKNIRTYIANSEYTNGYWVQKGVSEEQSIVLYNTIKKLLDKTKKKSGHNRNFRIGFVGRLVEWKHIEILIEAFSKLKDIENITLHLYGDGDKKNNLLQLVEILNLSDKVFFEGYTNNILDTIQSLDLLVLPSEKEPFGRVLVEAMQVGVPVIGSNSGGIPEIIENGENGLLFELNNINNLTEKMELILNNEELKNKFIKNGLQTVKKKFSIESYMKNLDNLYENIIKGE